MKSFAPSLLLCSLAALAWTAPAPRAPGAAAPVAVAQDRMQDFLREFEQARSLEDRDEMADVVREYRDEAIDRVIIVCEQIAERPTEELETEIAALREAWEAAFDGSRFVNEVYEYFSFLGPEYLRERAKRTDEFAKELERIAKLKADESTTPGLLDDAAMRMKAFAESFEQLGDHYQASSAWIQRAVLLDKALRGTDADPQAALEAYWKFVAARDRIDLRDGVYASSKDRARELQDVIGRGLPGGEDEGTGISSKAALAFEFGEPVTVALEHEPVDDVGEYERPSYYVDDVYQSWVVVGLQAEGTTARFPAMAKDEPLQVIRTGAAEASVDQDGDGEGDVEIPLTGNFEVVEVPIGAGPTRRPWSFLATIGTRQDYYQNIEVNLEPSDGFLNLYVAPAASLVGEVGGETIRILDDNLDGVYGSPPTQWAYDGTLEDDFQTDYDSVIVGRSKRAMPWSEYLRVGDQWYRFQIAENGHDLIATPAKLAIETGTIELDYDGPDLVSLVIKGTGDVLGHTYFDLAASKRGIEVPVGTYELHSGVVSEGKRQQVMKAIVVPGPTSGPIAVRAGETTEVKLGEPFGFEFQFEIDGEEVTVLGETVAVLGAYGERYERLWRCQPGPEASVREGGSRSSGESAEMDVIMDKQALEAGNWKDVWFPRDVTIDAGPSDTGYEVQLVEKKNDLFGKIESDWRSE